MDKLHTLVMYISDQPLQRLERVPVHIADHVKGAVNQYHGPRCHQSFTQPTFTLSQHAVAQPAYI